MYRRWGNLRFKKQGFSREAVQFNVGITCRKYDRRHAFNDRCPLPEAQPSKNCHAVFGLVNSIVQLLHTTNPGTFPLCPHQFSMTSDAS